MAREFELKGNHYSITKIDDAFEQTYLASRFAPVLANLSDAGIGGIFDSIGKLDKAIMKEIYFALLGCIKRQTGKSWASITTEDKLMYSDINMIDALLLAKEAFMENYEVFFQDAASILKDTKKTAE